MPRGGFRPGAGRPRGARNKLTVLKEVANRFGTTPLEYLLGVMRDQTLPDAVRILAAKAALPYCTPRLAAVRVCEDGHGLTHEEWVRRLAEILPPYAS
jgi:hypothetical protein